MATVWKIAPGEGAEDWAVCQKNGCIGLGWTELADFRRFKSKGEVLKALKHYIGEKKGNREGAARAIWYFFDQIQPSHVVVASEGLSAVVGIGLVRSEYLPPKS